MVKGIGPVSGKKLVEKFGEKIFDIIEHHSARLEEVEGIGPKRRHQIKAAWAEQKVIRTSWCSCIPKASAPAGPCASIKTYGENAIEKVRANPYALAKDIPGIGFKTADQIAQKIGIPHDSVLRACAGLDHVLLEADRPGPLRAAAGMLTDEAGKLLLVDRRHDEAALSEPWPTRELVREPIGGQELVFLPALETGGGKHCRGGSGALAGMPPAFPRD